MDYGLCFDTEIVETYSLSEPMSDLYKIRVYCVGLRAYYRLPHPIQPYADFTMLRARHKEINDMDIVPHELLILVPPPVLIYEPGVAPALEKGP